MKLSVKTLLLASVIGIYCTAKIAQPSVYEAKETVVFSKDINIENVYDTMLEYGFCASDDYLLDCSEAESKTAVLEGIGLTTQFQASTYIVKINCKDYSDTNKTTDRLIFVTGYDDESKIFTIYENGKESHIDFDYLLEIAYIGPEDKVIQINN